MKPQVNMKQLEAKVRPFLHMPADSTTATVRHMEWLQTAPRVTWEVHSVNNKNSFTPMLPGQITTVIARPGNGKTSTMVYLARRVAERCDFSKGECVIYITWEESIQQMEEKLLATMGGPTPKDIAWGDYNMDEVKKLFIKRVKIPLIILGKNMSHDASVARGPMYIETVRAIIEKLFYEFKLKPVLILGDHVHRIPIPKTRDRKSDLTEAMIDLDELTKDVNVSMVLGVQANRAVDKQTLPIATLAGAEGASAIEQVSHRMIGLLRPITVTPENGMPLDFVDINSQEYKVDDNLLIMRLLKQRDYLPKKHLYPLHFNPARFELKDFAKPQVV